MDKTYLLAVEELVGAHIAASGDHKFVEALVRATPKADGSSEHVATLERMLRNDRLARDLKATISDPNASANERQSAERMLKTIQSQK